MTRAVKMDAILTHFKEQSNAGELYIDMEIHNFLPTIGLTYDEDNDYDLVLKTFKEKNLIESGGNGYILTDNGRTFKSFEVLEKKRLRLLILEAIVDSYETGEYININNLLLINCPEMQMSELGKILRALYETNGYLKDATRMVQSVNRMILTVSKFVAAGHSVNLKISKEGFDYLENLNNPTPKHSNTIHITGSNNNVVNQSSNVKIKNLSNEDVAKAIPELVTLIKDMRNTDLDLLLAAVKDHNEQKEIDPNTFERVTGIMANLITIVTPVLQAGAGQ